MRGQGLKRLHTTVWIIMNHWWFFPPWIMAMWFICRLNQHMSRNRSSVLNLHLFSFLFVLTNIRLQQRARPEKKNSLVSPSLSLSACPRLPRQQGKPLPHTPQPSNPTVTQVRPSQIKAMCLESSLYEQLCLGLLVLWGCWCGNRWVHVPRYGKNKPLNCVRGL